MSKHSHYRMPQDDNLGEPLEIECSDPRCEESSKQETPITLEPCPFCGSTELESYCADTAIICNGCHAHGPISDGSRGSVAWNRRSSRASSAGMDNALSARIDDIDAALNDEAFCVTGNPDAIDTVLDQVTAHWLYIVAALRSAPPSAPSSLASEPQPEWCACGHPKNAEGSKYGHANGRGGPVCLDCQNEFRNDSRWLHAFGMYTDPQPSPPVDLHALAVRIASDVRYKLRPWIGTPKKGHDDHLLDGVEDILRDAFKEPR